MNGGNAYGGTRYCKPATSAPSKAPDAPRTVVSSSLSETEMRISWQAPIDKGGDEVTEYKVEWDTTPGVSEIQRVDVGSNAAPIDGSWHLSFESQQTTNLYWDASAADEDSPSFAHNWPSGGKSAIKQSLWSRAWLLVAHYFPNECW